MGPQNYKRANKTTFNTRAKERMHIVFDHFKLVAITAASSNAIFLHLLELSITNASS